MKPVPWADAEPYRLKLPGTQYESQWGDDYGAFLIPRNGVNLKVMVGIGYGWEHVSVSPQDTESRCPTWEEMCFVKDLFWPETEWVVQFGVPPKDYVNHHPYTLHWWRPTHEDLPHPHRWMVGPYDGWERESRLFMAAWEKKYGKY